MDDGHSRKVPGGGHTDALLGAVASLTPEVLVDVLAEAPVGVGLLDADLRWIYANSAFLSTTGLASAQIVSRPVSATPFAADVPTIHRILADGDPRDAPTADLGATGPGSAATTASTALP